MRLRALGPDDEDLLVDLVLEAVNWSGAARVTRTDVLADDHLHRYASGWPAPGDVGFAAVDDEGEPLGAAWVRLLPADRPGYGYVADDVPELSMAVRAHARGRGVGSALLDACLAAVRRSGAPAVSLSVEDGNEEARAMYVRRGFVPVGREGGSDVLVLRFPG